MKFGTRRSTRAARSTVAWDISGTDIIPVSSTFFSKTLVMNISTVSAFQVVKFEHIFEIKIQLYLF